MSKIIPRNNLKLESERIYLKLMEDKDINKSYLSWINDPAVNRFLESRFKKWTLRNLRKYVNDMQNNRDSLFFAIILKDRGRHIGNIKIGHINRIHKFADIGILIGDKSCWGKGYAKEAIKLVADYAFRSLKLHKLTAGAYATNAGSVKAFRKAGFSIEGVRLKHYRESAGYVDCVLMGCINEQAETI